MHEEDPEEEVQENIHRLVILAQATLPPYQRSTIMQDKNMSRSIDNITRPLYPPVPQAA